MFAIIIYYNSWITLDGLYCPSNQMEHYVFIKWFFFDNKDVWMVYIECLEIKAVYIILHYKNDLSKKNIDSTKCIHSYLVLGV